MTAHIETLALHGGNYRADPVTGAVALPIYQTTSYQFHDTAHAIRMFTLQEFGFTYTRTGNPTRDAAERRIAAIEGGAGALIVSSGAAARLYALLNVADAGDNIVADIPSQDFLELKHQFQRFGITLRKADREDPRSFQAATDERTRAYFAETLDLVTGTRLDAGAIAKAGKDRGVPLIVDNSLMPAIARPIDDGAAVVVYRGDGFLTGQTGNQSGVIVDGGRFDWKSSASPSLTLPDSSYHGAIWTDVADHFGVPLAYLIRARMRFLRDFGGAVSPFEVFSLIQGLETLPLRIRDQSRTAEALYDFAADHRGFTGADHLGGKSTPLIRLRLPDVTAAQRFRQALRLIGTAPLAGGRRSVIFPVGDGATLILSAGLEYPDDLRDDLRQAADAALT